MATAANTTSIVVSFGNQSAAATAANAHLSAQIDSRPTGLNGGVTSFNPGDTAWFLIFMSDNVALDGAPVASAGTIGGGQLVSGITISEQLTFANVNTASLSVPATSISATKWLGTSLGSLTLTGNNSTVQSDQTGVAVAKVDFLADALAYSITAPTVLDGETAFGIVLVINGKLIA